MPRTSALRLALLHELQTAPAKSVTELATRVGKLRPSVSRSLNALRHEGLVTYEDREWRITATGQREIERATKNLQDSLERVQRSFSALSRIAPPAIPIESVRAFDAISSSHKALQSMFRTNATAVQRFTDSFSAFDSALKPLFQAQIRNSALMDMSLKIDQMTPGLSSLLQHNNRSIASAIDDSLALRNLELTHPSDSLLPQLKGFPPVSEHLSAITASVEAIGREFSLEAAHRSHSADHAPIMVVAPPTAAAAYTRATRLWFEGGSAVGPPEGYPLGNPATEIRAWLAELDPSLAEMHRGAWDALTNGGPDSLRHAAVSMRELLRIVLKTLVPDESIEEGGKTRLKARLRKLLSGSESSAEFAMGMSLGIDGLYDRLNASTHGPKTDQGVLRGVLIAADGVLLVVLHHVRRRPPEPHR